MSALTRTAAASLSLALLATACADRSVAPSAGGIGHPTGAEDIILSIAWEGGFTPIEYTFTSVPVVALYGDGTLITPGPQLEMYPGPALPALTAVTLTEDEVQEVLADAIEAGLDRDADVSDLGNMGIADAGTAVFTLTTDAGTHRVTAYALGFTDDRIPGQPDDVREARERLAAFMDRMGSVGAGLDEQPYDASAAALLVGPFVGQPDVPQQPVAWPLDEGLDGIGEPWTYGDERCVVLDGENWTQVRRLAETATELTPWTDAGARYRVVFRPLLPHESACPR